MYTTPVVEVYVGTLVIFTLRVTEIVYAYKTSKVAMTYMDKRKFLIPLSDLVLDVISSTTTINIKQSEDLSHIWYILIANSGINQGYM